MTCSYIGSHPEVDDPCYEGALPTGVPSYGVGSGPQVRIDQTHCNKHNASVGYKGFKKLLTSDGYDVRTLSRSWQSSCGDSFANCTCSFCTDLSATKTLVIVNPVNEIGADEATIVEQWVNQGGNLMLVLDHCPFRGNATALITNLGSSFNWPTDELIQGTNEYPCALSNFSGFFCRGAGCPAGSDHGALWADQMTQGRSCSETVTNVETFTGFWLTGGGSTALQYPTGTLAKQNGENSCDDMAGGTSAGVWFQHGLGRVYFGAEAAMFTALCHGNSSNTVTCGDRSCNGPYGMQPGQGNQNEQYALNVIHWLDGLTPVACPQVYPCPEDCQPDLESYISTETCQSWCEQTGTPGPFTWGCDSGSLQHITMENYDCDCGGTSQSFICQ